MLRGPKKFPVLSDSSSGDEDVRRWRINTCNKRSQILSRGTRVENDNRGSSSTLNTEKRQNTLPVDSSDNSSGSEFQTNLQKTRRGSLRPLSDYDSGEGSSGMSTMSTRSGRTRQEDNTGNSHTSESSDSSSDFNVTRSGRKRHFNIVSSSESSDSGMPVACMRRSKRMRLESSSSNSSIDHSNNILSTVMNRPVSSNTRRRPTVTATVTSGAVRQGHVASRQMQPSNRNNNNRPNNRRRNNNSQAAVTGVQRSANTRTTRNSTPAVSPRQSNLRSTNNFTERENPNIDSITQSQRTETNSTSRINSPRPTRSQNNPITSRNRQVRPTFRVNRWNITDTNDGIVNMTQNASFPRDNFDTSSNDSDYSISSDMFRDNRFPLSSSSNSSLSSTSSDLTSSSDEIIPVRNLNRRNRHTRAIIESDDENNTNNIPVYEPGSEERHRNSLSSGNVSRPVEKCNKKEKEHSSDSEGESDKCPICLAGFKIQEIGTPKICDHSFCLVCLQEWAKNNNTCPVDRKLFNSIVVRAKVQGQPLREIAIETPAHPGQFNEQGEFNEPFWSTVAFHLGFTSDGDNSSVYSLFSEGDGPEETCCVCHLSNRSDFMIVCDYCYNVFHLDCVDPPLQYVPADDWNCPQCRVVEMQSHSDSSSSFSDFDIFDI